jgi:hypothetical protein
MAAHLVSAAEQGDGAVVGGDDPEHVAGDDGADLDEAMTVVDISTRLQILAPSARV